MSSSELPIEPLEAFRLPGKVAIVTGAATGIGRGCAEILAAAGATVVCADLADAAETVEIINGGGGVASPRRLDVRSEDSVAGVVADTVASYGRLDVMVNNAGTHIRQPALETTEQAFDDILAINLKGVFFGCKAAGTVMAAHGGGSIVNIASAIIDGAGPGTLAYGASKAGVHQMTRTLAIELGPLGVRVNTIAPGWVLTELTRRVNTGGVDQTDAQALAAQQQRVAEASPLGRTGTPADIAYAALYLASAASDWMTGHALRVNGGAFIPW